MYDTDRKITADHLRRGAYLYVRQSTLRQVFENTESTARQYALRERAVALGWRTECVIVIDRDLGLSGATADREGFQHHSDAVLLGLDAAAQEAHIPEPQREPRDFEGKPDAKRDAAAALAGAGEHSQTAAGACLRVQPGGADEVGHGDRYAPYAPRSRAAAG